MLASHNVRWTSISRLDTTFVFARTHSLDWFVRSGWIESCVREEFECFDDDDVELTEDEDGRELVTVNGEPVAEVHNARLVGYVAGLNAMEAA